ncbi:helix-turn-helix transcriptional regulator [Shinella sp. M27]|uniref:helix-turn-helix transcriptional regulator n=1 Tax=Shinella sp. M27 TaxID=3368614 RepID=UPI003BA3AB3A
MIHIGVNGDYFVEPLGQHEVQALGCALYLQKRHKVLTYLAIHQITDQFAGKAMNTPMIYKSLNRLVARGLLIGDDQAQTESGEPLRTKAYRITESGKEAFRLAIMNARILAAAQHVVAA